MTFSDIVSYMEKENNDIDIFRSNLYTYVETTLNEYELNLKAAELKVMKESGNMSDLVFLENEASEGALVKIGKAIKALIQKVKDFIVNTIEKIKNLFNNDKSDKLLDRTATVVKKNKYLNTVKINMVDGDKLTRCYNKAEDSMSSLLSRVKTEKDVYTTMSEDSNKIIKDLDSDVTGVAILAVGIVGAIEMIKRLVKEVNKESESCDKLQQMVEKQMSEFSDPDTAREVLAVIDDATSVMRRKTRNLSSIITKGIRDIKHSLNGEGILDLPDTSEKIDADKLLGGKSKKGDKDSESLSNRKLGSWKFENDDKQKQQGASNKYGSWGVPVDESVIHIDVDKILDSLSASVE